MEIKALEIRDDCTHIPALAIKMQAENIIQAWYIHDRCGYPLDGSCIVLMKLSDCKANNDPYSWTNSRTMSVSHDYIYDHFDELNDGDVVDVQFILGKTEAPCETERPCESRNTL